MELEKTHTAGSAKKIASLGLYLPAVLLLILFISILSWNRAREGPALFESLRMSDWEIRLGDEGREWSPLQLDGLDMVQIPKGYQGYYLLRTALPAELPSRDGQLYVKGFRHFQINVEDRSVYDFNMAEPDFKVNKFLHWSLVPLEPEDAGKMLYVRVLQKDLDKRFGDFLIGTTQDFYSDMMYRDAFRVIFCLLFLGLSLLSFVLFASNRKQYMYLYFAVLTVCAAYGSIVRAHIIQFFIDLPLFVYLQDVAIPIGAGALMGFLSEMYAHSTMKRTFRFFAAVLGSFALLVLYEALHDDAAYHFYIEKVFLLIIIVFMPIVLFLLTRAYRKDKDTDTLWIFAGCVLLVLFAILHYIQMNVYSYTYLLFRWFPIATMYLSETQIIFGAFLFVLCLAAVLIGRYQETHQRVRVYADELTRKNEQLQALDQLKDDFLARTSHELRTPLYGMIGLTESLIEQAGPETNEAVAGRLQLILTSGRRLARLVNDILDVSKLKHNDIKLRKRQVDLPQVVEVAVAMLEPLAKAKGLRLYADVSTGTMPPVYGDEDRIEQILINLIGNSIKFTQSGEIKVSASTVGDLVRVSVSDTGVGIAPEELQRIFEPFRQVEGTEERSAFGTGLGLTVSRQLARLHDGELTVSSEQGRGSAFSFTLPCFRADEHSAAASGGGLGTVLSDGAFRTGNMILDLYEATQPQAYEGRLAGSQDAAASSASVSGSAWADGPQSDSSEGWILVVDDEPMNLEVLTSQLSSVYRVKACASGREALEWLASGHRPDLVISDVMMPGMNGLELCMRIRETYSEADLPILLLTAKNLPEDLAEGFVSGANDYLTKPVSMRELLSRVQLHCKLAKWNRTLEEQVSLRTEELERRNRQLQSSIHETMEILQEAVAMEERNRMSKEIHDIVGHTITTAIIQMEATKMLFERDRPLALEKLSICQELMRNGMNEIREVIRMLKDDGAKGELSESLVELLVNTQRSTQAEIAYRIDVLPDLAPIYSKVLYRALQEGLTNGLRHGGSTQFDFALTYSSAEHALHFCLKNNGSAPAHLTFGFGLSAMSERVAHLGGTLQVTHGEERGFALDIHIPLRMGVKAG